MVTILHGEVCRWFSRLEQWHPRSGDIRKQDLVWLKGRRTVEGMKNIWSLFSCDDIANQFCIIYQAMIHPFLWPTLCLYPWLSVLYRKECIIKAVGTDISLIFLWTFSLGFASCEHSINLPADNDAFYLLILYSHPYKQTIYLVLYKHPLCTLRIWSVKPLMCLFDERKGVFCRMNDKM